MPFSALLDANVLVPSCLRDTLLRIAEAGLYRPLWSRDILAETERNILRIGPDLDPGRVRNTLVDMDEAFEGASVSGYEGIVASMTNNPKDRHVLAAAVVGRADVIVTNDLPGFPEQACRPYDIEVQKPDVFLTNQYDLAPGGVARVIQEQSDDTGRRHGHPQIPVQDILRSLSKTGAPEFAGRLAAHLGL